MVNVDVGGRENAVHMNDKIELFETNDGTLNLEVRTDGDTVWLTADQIASLFGRDKSTISRHLSNLFSEGELVQDSVVANFATTALDGKAYLTKHYDLDVIISVGYRVKSVEGVRFRRWATDVLKKYAVSGVAVNEKRLQEIGKIVTILGRSADEVLAGVAEVLQSYIPGLTVLRDYDSGTLSAKPVTLPSWQLTIEEAREVIAGVAREFPEDTLLGNERGGALEGVINAIYQGFAGQDLYPTVEEKAANLLYLIVKDHPLSDGNKRSGAALFVTFLAKNNLLHTVSGQPRVNNNTLAAITLLVAMSDPKEKETMIKLLVRMLTEEAQ